MAAIRTIVIDHQISVREMLVEELMRGGTDCHVVGQAGSGQEAAALSARTKPAMAITSLEIPDLPGPEMVRLLRGAEPGECRVLIYAGTRDRVLIADALRAGPAGFVHRTESLGTLRLAVNAVAEGASYFSPLAAGLLFREAAWQRTRVLRSPATSSESKIEGGNETVVGMAGSSGNLSTREREILYLVAQGLSSKMISAQLGVASRTVENHRARLNSKLGTNSAAGLMRYAYKAGLMPTD